MRLLLDTHAFIYFVNGDEQLSPIAKAAILESQNLKFISVASIWEISIKVSLGKLDLNKPLNFLPELIDQNGFVLQEIEIADTLTISALPFLHRDPFDRMLIAQATNNNFTIITKDSQFARYGVNVLW